MMNVVILSAFRNMVGRVERYMSQVSALQRYLEPKSSTVRVVAVEGDSMDNTAAALAAEAKRVGVPLSIVKHDHGQRIFRSTEDADRLSALTGVMVTAWGAVDPGDDIVLYVESDLFWKPEPVAELLNLAFARENGFDVIAPLVFAGDHFYDTWAFRKDGTRFSPLPPYHDKLLPAGLTEVDSVGSCLAVRAEAVSRVAPIGELGLVSWCVGARHAGLRIGVAAELRIDHPC